MAPLVEQLQQDALDKNINISDLLRKAKAAASKLNLADAVSWVELELSGYTNAEAPDYREIHGKPMALDPYQGWIPIMFINDHKIQSLISSRRIDNSISELEHLAKVKGPLHLPFTPDQISILADSMKTAPVPMALFVGHDQIVGILDAVRTKILDWALNLEKAGIHGDGLSFSAKEKEAAAAASVVYQIGNIGNFTGNLGPVTGNTNITSTQISKEVIANIEKFLQQIQAAQHQLALPKSEAEDLKSQIAALSKEIKSDRPEPQKIVGILQSIKNVAEGATGNLVGSGVIAVIEKLLSAITG